MSNKNYECDDKLVSHPAHYQSVGGLEVIDVIKAFTAGLEGIEATDTGNVIKYICRWKSKNGLQDLKKAQWYLTHLINEVEAKIKASEGCVMVDENEFVDLSRCSPNYEFDTAEIAAEALLRLRKIIDAYGFVTIADFMDICGKPSLPADSEVGWVKLGNDVDIMSYIDCITGKNLWHITLPNPVRIKRTINPKENN